MQWSSVKEATSVRRFFVSSPLSPDMSIIGDDVRHIGKVLRMQNGDKIIVVDPAGKAGIARIEEIKAEAVLVSLEQVLDEQKEPPIRVFIAQGLPKSDKMDYIVQKAVELGVAGIMPMAADHSVVQYNPAKQASRVERWQKIAEEAAKQCGRGVVPRVEDVKPLFDIINAVPDDASLVMLYEGQAKTGLKEILNVCRPGTYVLLIGPEGGFSEKEVALASQRGAYIVKMGPRILRTETASLAALSAVMYACGDLGG